MRCHVQYSVCLLMACKTLANSQTPKIAQLQPAIKYTAGQNETTDNGAQDSTEYSLRIGPRGPVLLEDTIGRKKMFHFDHERQPERAVHALGHGAYGTFESSGDWSNLTSACWLQKGVTSDVFTRFSVVVAGIGGSESGRDTHGFATKIYSECGNQDLVGNNLPSFFINDGILFPDLVHAVKAEPDKGFPTGGSAHNTAYDFFTQRPEGALQLMNVLSDLGIPRDTRHMNGAGVHTFRFLNATGASFLFKWYWNSNQGLRSLIYDEATKIAGKNNNFQRVDLYSAIADGHFPSWDFMVQVFPDDGSYMYQGIDLLDPTQVVPFEVMAPVKMGTLTLNQNPTNFFAEAENVAYSPANTVDGITFVPDPLLAWRLVSYDDTQSHRHSSSNFFQLPVNQPVAPVNNNFRDGYMQTNIYAGASASSPNSVGGVMGASPQAALAWGNEMFNGTIGRYGSNNASFAQATSFWNLLDDHAKQHTVDAYRFELGHVSDPQVQANYISKILHPIDNCLARRVAYGIGSPLPALSPSTANGTMKIPTYPSQYQLTTTTPMSVVALVVAILADDTTLSPVDLAAISAVFAPACLGFEVVAPYQGRLKSGVVANNSYITTSSIFYDALIVPDMVSGNSSGNPSTSMPVVQEFIREAYGHGKPLGGFGAGATVLSGLGYGGNAALGVVSGTGAGDVASQVLKMLQSPGRFPQRQALDDVGSICS